MRWQRLDRDTSIKVINSVKSDADMGLFAIGTSEVQRARVPFYNGYEIYKVTNYASLPSFTFEYLSDGTFFHYLDGTEGPIHTVNDKGALNLSSSYVLDYLAFYFTHVGGDDGDIFIIVNPHDMPLLDSLDSEVYHAVFSQHQPAEIRESANGGLEVETDLYIESQLVRAVIEVTAKGRVTIKEQKMIMHEMLASGAPEAIL